jgi:hypothetical protein
MVQEDMARAGKLMDVVFRSGVAERDQNSECPNKSRKRIVAPEDGSLLGFVRSEACLARQLASTMVESGPFLRTRLAISVVRVETPDFRAANEAVNGLAGH